MSRNLMGLFQRPFMDWDGALPHSLSSLLALFHSVPDGAFYGLITTLLSKSIDRGDEMRLSTLPAHFHDKGGRAEPRARSANDGQHSIAVSVQMRWIHS